MNCFAGRNARCFATATMLALLATSGCKRNAPASSGEPKPAASTAYTTVDNATAGTITGTIHFAKTPPPRVQIDMAQDPVCGIAPDNFSEQYVVKNGGLQNVYVYIREGLGGKIYAPSTTPVVLDQKGCRYTPHVIAAMVGQPVDFRNSDATMHNVHLMPDVNGNQSMDVSQPPRGGETQRVFSKPEYMLPVRCNNHPWMQAFVNISPNPFFAVSDEDGHFAIKGLPPGTYTLVAIHEVLGEQSKQLTVKPLGATIADFSFAAPLGTPAN